MTFSARGVVGKRSEIRVVGEPEDLFEVLAQLHVERERGPVPRFCHESRLGRVRRRVSISRSRSSTVMFGYV